MGARIECLKVAVAICTATIVALCATAASAQDNDAMRERAKNGVVMIRGKWLTQSASGAGIVVGVSGQDVYIVTAGHVINADGVGPALTVEVEFKARPKEWYAARALAGDAGSYDIAALRIALPAGLRAEQITGAGIAPPNATTRGTDVFPVGFPEGTAWSDPVRPDKVSTVRRDNITFQSNFVREGHSGGPLLDSCGRVVGMVVERRPPEAYALPIDLIVDRLKEWSVPTHLMALHASACAVDASNVTPAPRRPSAAVDEPAPPEVAPATEQSPPRSEFSPALAVLFIAVIAAVGIVVFKFMVSTGSTTRSRGTESSSSDDRLVVDVAPTDTGSPESFVISPAAPPSAQPPSVALDSAPAAAKIFLSYRREDSADVAGRIYDRLVARFGKKHIFKDVDSIPFGVDFRKHIEQRVGECDVLLAVIGDRWLSAGGSVKRLDNEKDYVRIELEAALKRDIPVVPVLVRGATVPNEDDVPGALGSLAYRNGIAVRPDPDFHHDMDRLIEGIVNHLTSGTS